MCVYNIYCELTCSPNQIVFIDVLSVSKVNNNINGDGIDLYKWLFWGRGLQLKKRCRIWYLLTIEFIDAVADNFCEWYAVDE